jgi:leader peptidase (prepilin peptidase)/N-methyltransferase
MPTPSWLLVADTELWPAFAAALGLVVGSFANVCVYRLPREESVVRPRSRCPGCGAFIAGRDNVPLFSYLCLRGRCRACHAPISARYPAVEAANGLLYLGVALLQPPGPGALVTMAFLTALLILALIDVEVHLLPNAITRPGIAIGIATSVWSGMPTPLGSRLILLICPRLCLPIPLLESAAAALVGYVCLALLALLARWYYGEEALGQGDWKLVAMIGAFRGSAGMWTGAFLGTFLGAMAGIFLLLTGKGNRRTHIPLGAFLCAGSAVEVFLGLRLLAWYRGLFVIG